MLLKIKKVKTEEETVELKLPAFFKSEYYAVAINEDSVIEVTYKGDTGHLIMSTKNTTSLYSQKVGDYIQREPITKTEFYFVFEQALKSLDEQISKPV